ncbi:hypothetical protein OMW55_00210 [Sphingomonas sp. BN140010]|uniref:CPBP family intramembrane metalloprotease n=1 Tax=Sphingomonas arvum TaxID=2992113 RepID=A0ABT3JAY5_9SPHN|nr:hypothetical protein [Sphingomonas sp. BN140010]MCW3796233.1 hypothetical protein [Sphingomonas sp. BN140010]
MLQQAIRAALPDRPGRKDAAHPARLAGAIAFSCALAFLIPYDVLFDRLTAGSALARAVAMLLLWCTGLALVRANGLQLGLTGLRRPVLTIGAWAVGVAIWCIVLDAVVFRSIMAAPYEQFEQLPLSVRLLYVCSRAVNENVIYRLFLGSLLGWLLRRVVRRPRWDLLLLMTGMAAAQAINVAANMAYVDWSALTCLWLLLRFVCPGVAWAWLYVRHGFAANEAAAVGVHLVLQPLVTIAF